MSTQPKALRLADRLMHGNPTWTRREAAAELRRLHLHELALAQWLEKTEWVQVSAEPIELGRHRADAIQMRVARLHALNQELLDALETALQAFHEMHHARTRPDWFTKGREAAVQHEFMWSQRGVEAVSAAIAKANTAQKVFPKAVADATI